MSDAALAALAAVLTAAVALLEQRRDRQLRREGRRRTRSGDHEHAEEDE